MELKIYFYQLFSSFIMYLRFRSIFKLYKNLIKKKPLDIKKFQ